MINFLWFARQLHLSENDLAALTGGKVIVERHVFCRTSFGFVCHSLIYRSSQGLKRSSPVILKEMPCSSNSTFALSKKRTEFHL